MMASAFLVYVKFKISNEFLIIPESDLTYFCKIFSSAYFERYDFIIYPKYALNTNFNYAKNKI
jgi:hypothetical protein